MLWISLPDSPVSWRGDEVQAAVDPAVRHLPSVHPGLWVQVVLKLAVYVVDDWLPAAGNKVTASVKKQRTPWIRDEERSFDILRIINEGTVSVLSWSCGDSYQLLLSTASPNPGVSTIVSSSWTPPSFIKTLHCSTCTGEGMCVYFCHKLWL